MNTNAISATRSPVHDPRKVASQVQSMFVEIMLKSMEDSVQAEDGLFGSSVSSETYRSMFREELARALSGQLGDSLTDPLQKASTAAPEIDARPAPLPIPGRVSSPIGWRRDPINGDLRFHRGTDIAAPEGSSIRAVAPGRVIESGPRGSYGNAVVIETADGQRQLYAHNLRNFVIPGQFVEAGSVIAEVGSTGRSTGPHLHFEVMTP